jgi:hypothetical protein
MILVLSCTTKVIAQRMVFFNSKPVDTLRYVDVKGSPYLYQEWKKADITSRNGTFYDHVLLNYNGYTKKFEVSEQGIIVALDETLYDKIIVYLEDTDDGKKEWFLKGVHYDIATFFTNVIFNSEKVKLIRNFDVRLAESSYEVYGDVNIRKKFVQNRYYSILYNSKLHLVRHTKQKLSKIFENKELVYKILQENNLDISVEEDLIEFLAILETHLP